MTTNEYLLIQLAEECAEVAQRVSKALRFGLREVQEGQNENNSQRISRELNDLVAVVMRLRERKVLREVTTTDNFQIQCKMEKLDRYINYSKGLGIIKDKEPVE